MTNTLIAPNYSEVLEERTNQGKQSDYLVFQAPDRLGGYIQSGNRRSYVYVIGSTEYQSLTVSAGTPTKKLTFYQQASQGARNWTRPTATSPTQPRRSTRPIPGIPIRSR